MAGLTYNVIDNATGNSKGALNATVLAPEPTFTRHINGGYDTIRVRIGQLASTVSNLNAFDLVEVLRPDATRLGYWKYEVDDGDYSQSDVDTLELIPMVAELTDVDCATTAIYVSPAVLALGLGTAKFSLTVTDALARTKHCTPGTITDDGNTYALNYSHSRVKHPLDNAVNLGGNNWWWADSYGTGLIDLKTGPRNQFTLDARCIIWQKRKASYEQAYNVIVVTGAQDPVTQLPLTSTTTTTTGAFSVTAIGRRVAPPYADQAVYSTAALAQMGATILARSQVKQTTLTVRVATNTTVSPNVVQPKLYCGDQAQIPGDATWYWVTSVSEEGSTGTQVLTLQSQFGGYHSSTAPGGSNLQQIQASTGVYGSSSSGTATGPACGGMALFFELGGEVTPTIVGGLAQMVIDQQTFVVDSTGGAAVLAIIDASVKAPSTAGAYMELTVLVAGQASRPGRIRMSGEWENVTRRVTSPVLAAGSYTASAYLTYSGASGGALDIVYDLNVYVV